LRPLGRAPGGNFAAQNIGIWHISTFCPALHFLCAVKLPKQAACGTLRGIWRSKLGQGPVFDVGRPFPSSEHCRNNPNCTFQTPVNSIVFLMALAKKGNGGQSHGAMRVSRPFGRPGMPTRGCDGRSWSQKLNARRLASSVILGLRTVT
jgi:hypothetical protein